MYSFYPVNGVDIDRNTIIESLQETDEYCWGELVRWSVSGKCPGKFISMMPEKGYSTCEKEGEENSCMCGRFCKDGFFATGNSNEDEQDILPF